MFAQNSQAWLCCSDCCATDRIWVSMLCLLLWINKNKSFPACLQFRFSLLANHTESEQSAFTVNGFYLAHLFFLRRDQFNSRLLWFLTCVFWNVFIDPVCLCVFQISAGVQLLGVVCLLHHPRSPESCQPRPLHPGETPPPSFFHTNTHWPQHPPSYLFTHTTHSQQFMCLHACCFVCRWRRRQPCKQVGGFRCCWLRRKSQTRSTNPNSYPIISPLPLCSSCFIER